VSAPDVAPKRFDCRGGYPAGYQRASLWYQVDLTRHPRYGGNLVLMVHNSRFDRLAVGFSYADGVVLWQQVRAGTYGTHWRSGGQITFEAPERDSPLKAATLRFDRPASARLLRMRLMSHGEEARQATALAASVGAALMLLLIGALFNASLACAIRRQFPAWQSAWSACMLLWGAIWSQVHLFLFPGMAGTYSAQFCTALACLAITLATAAAITAPDRNAIPRVLRIGTLALGAMIGLLGVPLAFMRTGPIDLMGDLLEILTLVDLVAVASCLGIAWRRGSQEAIGVIIGWSLPMLTLGATLFIDTQTLFWGGGAQILVLFAAAWQTLWLSIAASRTHARLRIERDRARSAEAHAHELARRDPLTGLRNRRFLDNYLNREVTRCFRYQHPLAVILLDIDHFKLFNDRHGHQVGDDCLRMVATQIRHCVARDSDVVARYGGEEFCIVLPETDMEGARAVAERVRRRVAETPFRVANENITVTISAGVTSAVPLAPGQEVVLLQRADEGLYQSKDEGRNRVTCLPG